jgi:hypothetical protein
MNLKGLLFLLLISILVSGCNARTTDSLSPSAADDQAVQLILHLAKDQEIYTVGEFIVLELQINNERESLLEISNLRFSELAFSEPNSMHLLSPGGEDLLVPYKRKVNEIEQQSAIRINAKEEKWLYLRLSNYLHLRQPGQYEFWLEIEDSEGNRYLSNKIGFIILGIEPSVPSDEIELLLESRISQLSSLEPIYFKTRFTNKSDETITFLKPQDGSFFGWINPVYQFTIIDESGRSLPAPPRSGTLGFPTFNDQTKFTLLPEASFEQGLMLPSLFIYNKGTYKIRLTYIVHEHDFRMGILTDQVMNWEKDVFTGLLESNDITITVD